MQKIHRRLIVVIILIVVSLFFLPAQTVHADGEISLPAGINEAFLPISIPAGGVSTLSFTIYNPNTFPLSLSTSPAAFTEVLPDGLTFATPIATTSTCGGIVTAFGNTLSLSGGTVPAQSGSVRGSCIFTVAVTSIVPGSIYNDIPASALHSTDPSGTLFITNTDPATVTLTVNSLQPPSLSKTFNKSTIWVGQTSVMTIRIMNNDLNYSLTKTSVVDTLPANITLASTSFSSSNCGSPTVTQPDNSPLVVGITAIKISNATIPLNSTCSIGVTVTSNTTGTYLNTIPAHAVQTQQGVTNSSSASAPLNVQNISMSKSFSPGNVVSNGTSTLSVTLVNPSSLDYTGVQFTDTLPSGMTVVQPTVFTTTCGSGTVSTNAANSTVALTGGTIPHAISGTPGTCTVTALIKVSSAGTYTNSIPAGNLTTDIPGVTNISSATANLSVYGIGYGLNVSKSFTPSTIPVGATSTLKVNITAPADIALHLVSLTDALPTGMTVANTPVAGTTLDCGGGTFTPAAGDTLLSFSSGTVGAGKTCTLSVNVVTNGMGTFTNVISRTNISDQEDRNITGNVSATLTVSGLSVDKAFYPTNVNVNGISTLTIKLTNGNYEQLDHVQFTDTLPANLVVAPVTNLVTDCGTGVTANPGSGSISLSEGTIPAMVGAVKGICTINVDVKALATGTKNNSIAAGAVQGVLHTSGVSITNPVGTSASLQVHILTIDVNKAFTPIQVHGLGSSTLSVLLHNPNSYQLVGINFTDNLPQYSSGYGIQIAPAPNASVGSCGGAISANAGDTSFNFSGGVLNANASCTLTVDVIMNKEGNLINTIPVLGVTSTNGGSNDKPAIATLYNDPGASLTKLFSNVSGLNATLTIKVNNLAGFPITGIILTDNFPDDISVVSADTSQCGGTVTTSAHTVTLSGGTVTDLSTCEVVVQVVADKAGSFQNCILANSMSSTQGVTNPEAACDTLTVTETNDPPQITKTFSPHSIQQGSNSQLSFTITNPNADVMTGVSFSDTLPANMTLTSIPNVTQCGGTISSTPGSLELSGGTIAANSSCTIVASVTTSTLGEFPNSTTYVTSTNAGTGNLDSDTLTVIAPPSISKHFDPDSIPAAGTSTLVFEVANSAANTVALTGVGFVDSLPTGVKVAATPNAVVSADCGSAVFAPQADDTSLTFSNATIAVGATCTVSVDVTAENGGTYINTSGAVASTNGGSGNTAIATLTVSGPGLTLLKSTDTANYQATGDSIDYAYLLINSGDTTLYSPFMISDNQIGSPKGTAFACGAVASLAPGETTACSATYSVTDEDVSAKSVTNIATGSAVDDLGKTVISNESTVTVNETQLTIDKSTTTLSFLTAGNEIDYSYNLTNTGKATLYAPFTVVDDQIGTPKGTEFACGAASSLAPGANISCTSKYKVTDADVTAGSVVNTAEAHAKDAETGGADVISKPDSVTVLKLDRPLISKVFSPNIIAIGQTSTLTFTILNPNADPLLGVAFTDKLPTGMTVIFPPDAAQCGGTVAWNSSTNTLSLSNGSIIGPSCTITATVTASVAGSLVNTTSTVTTSNGGVGNFATATLTVVQAGLISKSFVPDSILEGGISTLTFLLTNPATNTDVLNGIAFTDPLPAGVTVAATPNVSVDNCGAGAVFNPVSGDTQLSFSSGSLAIGNTCTLKVDVTAPLTGTYDNTTSGTTSTNGGDGAPSNTATLYVNQAVDLSISKTDGVIDVSRSDALTYTLVVENYGPSNATNAKVVDAFPASLTGISWSCAATGTGASCTASGTGSIIDTVNVPVGTSLTYTVSAKVDPTASTYVLNNASVYPPDAMLDTNLANNSASDIDYLNLLTIDKTADVSSVNAVGKLINYTYVVQNAGSSTLHSPFAVLDDKLTPTCISVPTTLIPGASFTCTGVHTVTKAEMDSGTIVNNAYATGEDIENDTVTSNIDTVTVTATQIPLIGLAKALSGVSKVSTNTYNVTFVFRAQNYGNVTISDLQLQDDLAVTFPSPIAFTVRSLDSSDFLVNADFDGTSDKELLAPGNNLGEAKSGEIQLVIRVVPTSHGIFYNSATIGGSSPAAVSVTDVSQNGTNPDYDNNGNPTNDNQPTPIDFGSKIFDPAYGVKILDTSSMPVMKWTVSWINNKNILPFLNTAYDPIPESTEYIADFIDSGIAPPGGAPAGSTSQGVKCMASGASITTLCYYEAPTSANPRGQVVWQGILAPDFDVFDPLLAANDVEITFSTRFQNTSSRVVNTATIDSDLNGNGATADSGEQKVASASADWTLQKISLPVTGFTPGVITQLPTQPKSLAFSALNDLWIEIPGLNMQSTVIGVPQSSGGWNISWLGKDTGWLNGTAFPTRPGNSVLTGHIFDANGQPGPFANINRLEYGDQIIVHAWNQQYVYEVRDTKVISPEDTEAVLKHETASWITLLTCRDYDEKSGTYLERYIVRAVLIKVK